MKYTSDFFDQIIDRRGTYCAKYDSMYQFFGSDKELIDSLIPMWIADTEFRSPVELTEAVSRRVQNGAFGYGMLSGNKFRPCVRAWHQRRNHIDYDEDDIFIRRSTLTPLACAVEALSKRGEKICTLTPTYGHFHQIVKEMGRVPVHVHLTHDGKRYAMDYNALEQTLAAGNIKLMIFCNPHNPTGRVWSKNELCRLVRICREHRVPILSDEIHSDIIMPGHTFTPLMRVARALGYEDGVMVTSSTSKTFNTAGMNVGYYICHGERLKQLMAAAEERMQESDPVSAFSYITLEQCYGHGDSYVDTMCSYVNANYQLLLQALDALPYRSKIMVAPLEGTYLAWIQLLDSGLENRPATLHFVQYGLALEAGDQFYEDEGTFLRLNLAAPKSVIEEAVRRLLHGLDEIYR